MYSQLMMHGQKNIKISKFIYGEIKSRLKSGNTSTIRFFYWSADQTYMG